MMDDEFIRRMEQSLQRRLSDLEETEAQNERDRAPVELDQTRVGRLSRVDAMQGQAMAEAQQERRRIERLRIETALARIDDGTYGECMRCGDEIAEKRLAADPATPVCVDCAGNP